jgi:hypothetical protein
MVFTARSESRSRVSDGTCPRGMSQVSQGGGQAARRLRHRTRTARVTVGMDRLLRPWTTADGGRRGSLVRMISVDCGEGDCDDEDDEDDDDEYDWRWEWVVERKEGEERRALPFLLCCCSSLTFCVDNNSPREKEKGVISVA